MLISVGISDHSLAYLTGVTGSWGSRSMCMCSMSRQKAALRSHGNSLSAIHLKTMQGKMNKATKRAQVGERVASYWVKNSNVFTESLQTCNSTTPSGGCFSWCSNTEIRLQTGSLNTYEATWTHEPPPSHEKSHQNTPFNPYLILLLRNPCTVKRNLTIG